MGTGPEIYRKLGTLPDLNIRDPVSVVLMTEFIIVGSGLLGQAFGHILAGRYQAVLTHNSHPVKIEGIASRSLDLLGDLELINQFSPKCIILTAAMTNVDQCELDRESAWRINALGPRNVALAAQKVCAKLVYVSTDYVFSGEQGLFQENDPTLPINFYGESKLAGERFVQEICPDSVIARTSVLYGWNPVRQNFVTWLIDELRAGHKINIVTDQYTSPTLAGNLAEMILAIKNQSGTFHAAGSERISRYDFALKIAKIFGLEATLINPITSDKLSWKARRPMDSSLDVSKISLSAKPLSVDEGLTAMRETEMANKGATN